MTPEELRACPPHTKLIYVVGEGAAEQRFSAERRDHGSGWVRIKVWLAADDAPTYRWSMVTNQPIGQSRGHVGKVRLERA